jgi:glutamyl-tRNA synthetase
MVHNQKVRVRIAPSPTGDPHVGTAYVALFNYALAKRLGGQFVLRIEDTDQTRFRANSEQMILDSLKWLGLEWDEGPDVGGPHGPYRQSERRDIYRHHVEMLLANQTAYCCFCTPERLAEVREKQKAQGQTTRYDRYCRDLDGTEVDRLRAEGTPFVVRLKMPTDGKISFRDELRGEVEFEAERMDDQVLLKSDGLPTYHLANVVDDHLMGITHVMRAEEWISSTPKHVMLYQAFSWQPPFFIHLPLLRNPDKSKISKRKNPVSLNYYRRAGFLPKAMVNFLGLMGWSFGNDVELFSVNQMIEKFDYKDISLGGPVFDLEKLSWMNQQYLHRMSPTEFADHLYAEVFNRNYIEHLYTVAKERMSRFEQFVDNNSFFFNGALNYQGLEIVPKGRTVDEMIRIASELAERIDAMDEWSVSTIKAALDAYLADIGWKSKDFFMPLRLITTGRKDSPPLVESLEIIGREMVRFRLRDFAARAPNLQTPQR